ncbi:hypothetical protein CJD36_008720 [Flavipsychrobacter stenotrophus]|uniref:Secretion system C-terminal sorting domain-containing protein n=1 Tax=Flavipsychrobacter stenotrophus TaxID=2077091 RepID=A0A2S7SZ27_9BACT|nr:aryl-sulfate sulfotransferase [Flavipsychrobacter stenotrophus]PQJ11867.1 hypothetical protein CJD36_008720 [Flavipsychrobacter stenotrophus]
MKKFLLTLLFLPSLLNAQTIGLIQHSNGSNDDGYVLFAPITYTTTYLINKCGRLVHSWNSSYKPSQSVYILADGTLLRPGNTGNSIFTAGGTGGIIEKLAWDGTVQWNYTISDTTQCQHHDIKQLPNGNILAIVWELKSSADAIGAGRNPTLTGVTLWSEKIIELHPSGTNTATIVWEWHVWDHLVQDYDNTKPYYGTVANNPQLIDLNYAATTQTDWLHFNAIDYNPALDQVMISNHNFGEIWIIDHSTTTTQAASHAGGTSGKGGDLLYRWGNPAAYDNGTAADEKLWGQYNAHWIESGLPDAGKIMIFNNGHGLPAATNYSSVEIIDPPVNTSGAYISTLPYLPAASYWTYTASIPTDLFATNISGAQQLANGNVLICDGPAGDFFEIDTARNKVWDYINPVKNTGPMTQGTAPAQNAVFRCSFYPSNYSGFSGQTLIAGAPIEINPTAYTCDLTDVQHIERAKIEISPNPATDHLFIKSITGEISDVILYNAIGQVMILQSGATKTHELDLQYLPSGLYYLSMNCNNRRTVDKIIVSK